MAPALGYNSLCGVGSADPVDTAMSYIQEAVGSTDQFENQAGAVGERSEPDHRTRKVLERIGGSIQCQPTPTELDTWLEYILGGSKDGNDDITVADTLPEWHLEFDRDTERWHYNDCKVDNATFSAASGGILSLSLQIQAESETVRATAFPSISLAAEAPFVFSDATLSVNSTGYSFAQFSLSISNGLEPQYFNGLTPSRINATRRRVSLQLAAPYGDTTALHDLGVTGAAVVLTFTNGAVSCRFTMPSVQIPKQPPQRRGQGEYFLPLSGIARKSGSTPEITVRNDSTA